ncbi:MAG: flavin reductase family protein [Gemmatimonadota bacterium]|nr:flavin reductase family protein [Gemmatimonadota bacterium]
MSIDPKVFRSSLGRFATGVTVVTIPGKAGRRGMTANAFSSLSLAPPLVLVCFDLGAASLPLLREAGKFAVNFLAEAQKSVSDWFAGKGRDAADQFAEIPHEPGENGTPLLKGTLGFLECDLHAEHPGGDHSIVVGRVTRVVIEDEVRPPLMFYASAYRKMDMNGAYED